MTAPAIPDDVARFIRERIRSVGQLEVLLLLHRASDRWWSPDEVNGELRSSLHSALQCLEELRDARLLEERSAGGRAFRFHPAAADATPTVERLSEVFRDRMAAVIDCIYSERQNSIREFAEAFRLKKRDRDDG